MGGMAASGRIGAVHASQFGGGVWGMLMCFRFVCSGERVSPTDGLFVGGVIRSAGATTDRDVVNLPVLAMHQDRPASATDKIDGVVTRVEDRRHVNGAADEGGRDKFEADARVRGHRGSPTTGRSATTLSHRTPDVGDGDHGSPMPGRCLANIDHNGRNSRVMTPIGCVSDSDQTSRPFGRKPAR
jgi:hypothetical protein